MKRKPEPIAKTHLHLEQGSAFDRCPAPKLKKTENSKKAGPGEKKSQNLTTHIPVTVMTLKKRTTAFTAMTIRSRSG